MNNEGRVMHFDLKEEKKRMEDIFRNPTHV